jgi:hypothetical protein
MVWFGFWVKRPESCLLTNSYGIDTNWYVDIGATDHACDGWFWEAHYGGRDYTGGHRVYTASGAGIWRD